MSEIARVVSHSTQSGEAKTAKNVEQESWTIRLSGDVELTLRLMRNPSNGRVVLEQVTKVWNLTWTRSLFLGVDEPTPPGKLRFFTEEELDDPYHDPNSDGRKMYDYKLGRWLRDWKEEPK